MANVVLYVFLFDNLAGFNEALSESLLKNLPTNNTPILQKCDTNTSNQILSIVSKELAEELVPTFYNNGKPVISNANYVQDESLETFYSRLLQDSDDYLESTVEFMDNNVISSREFHQNYDSDIDYKRIITNNAVEIPNEMKIEQNYNNDIDPTKTNNSQEIQNVKKMAAFPKSAPFLVAIFESLSNVTAQTCAGTLISPRWVITAANCVNLLKGLYANDINLVDLEPSYTVVSGATDPLTDGSTHNVSTVIQYQKNSSCTKDRKSLADISPYVALMSIHPEFEGDVVPLAEEKIKSGNVVIYGWTMTKDEAGQDGLSMTSIAALVVSAAECQAMYSYNNSDVICLYNHESKGKNITMLSSGGPVLVVQGDEVRMLAVMQTDEQVVIAYPLYSYSQWITNVLKT